MAAKAPLVNGAAALLNLGEALYWYGVSRASPTTESLQALAECLVMAGENAIIYGLSRAAYSGKDETDKLKTSTSVGFFSNTFIGGLNYFVSYVREHVTSLDNPKVTYLTRSISRAAQPLVNMIGTGANVLEYDK